MTPGRAGSGEGGITLAALADRLGGAVDGDGRRVISGVAGLADAGPGDISFLASRRLVGEMEKTGAGAVIVDEKAPSCGRDVLRVPNPYLAFAGVLEIFHPRASRTPGIHESALVEKGARVSDSAVIGAFCHVGENASIGDRSVLLPHSILGSRSSLGADVLLHPRVTIGEKVQVGDRVIVHSGAVIGSDGFGYVFDGERHRKIPQVGGIEIGNDVEIGANATVDRATIGVTRIGEGTKIDNLVQIAHNVEVGRHAIIVAQVGISGSVTIGDDVVLGGQVGIVGHITIGDGARIGAQSGVIGDVSAGEMKSGMGPIPHRRWLRSQAIFDKLPELKRRLKELEKEMEEIKKRLPEERG